MLDAVRPDVVVIWGVVLVILLGALAVFRLGVFQNHEWLSILLVVLLFLGSAMFLLVANNAGRKLRAGSAHSRPLRILRVLLSIPLATIALLTILLGLSSVGLVITAGYRGLGGLPIGAVLVIVGYRFFRSAFPKRTTYSMTLSMIDLLIILSLLTVGAILGRLVAWLAGVPERWIPLVVLFGAAAAVLSFASPIYRLLRLRVMGRPPCPRCEEVPPGYRVLSGEYPRFVFGCSVCEQPLEAWMRRGVMPQEVAPDLPAFCLRWPEFLGRWRRVTSPPADTTS